MEKLNEIFRNYFCGELGLALSSMPDCFLTEVRARALKPLGVRLGKDSRFVRRDGRLTAEAGAALIVSLSDIKKTAERMSEYSPYAFAQQLQSGFLTLPGGHRVGFCGQADIQSGKMRGLSHISSLSLRVAREAPGCAAAVMGILSKAQSCLIISPPGGGKTTLLRDIARQISESGMSVAIADERSEIAGCFGGVPALDVGPWTDVLDGCPKAAAMHRLLRSMSPEIIITDEIGGEDDADAVLEMVTAGVKVITTAHGTGLGDFLRRPSLKKLRDANIFDAVIVLSGHESPGEIIDIWVNEGDGYESVDF